MTSLRAKPLKEQVVGELTRLIDEGALPRGSRLPGERTLADRLRVSRGTVREAVQFLEALGVLEIRHGSGTYVREATAEGEGLSAEWRAWTRRHSARVRDLLEVRRGLESFAAELAAERGSGEAREMLQAALEQMEAAVDGGDVPLLVQSDVRFHDAIVAASGNEPLAELTHAVGAQLLQERAATWDIPDRPARSLAEHREIHAAIESRDPARAREAVLMHMASIERDVARMVATTTSKKSDRRARHAS